MAGLLDLFSGRSSDIYGEGLLTPEQRGGLGNIGLLALAGKLGQLAGPSFSPVPDFGAALGQAAGAYGASQEGAGTAALNAILTAQKGRKLQQELDFSKQLGPILSKLAGQWPGADGGTAATPETGSTGGGAAAPLGAGGGGGGGTGGWGPHADTVVATLKEQGFSDAAIQGILANGLAEGGFASPWVAGDSGNSLGHWQFNNRGEMPGYLAFVKEQGGNPQDSRMQALYVAKRAKEIDPNFAQIDDPRKATDIFATKFERYQGAAPGQRYGQLATVQQRLGGGAPTAAAPADGVRVPYNYGAPSGGLLAPNPLSDAEPMVGIPRPARQAQLALTNAYADALQNGFRGTIQDFVASRGTSGGGGPLAAPPGAGGDPIMSVTSADQAGGGEPPRAPLPTMGPTGVELPPMQGPLAAPAPAAAAPAAAGPGLLSPPGALPAAPALPRGNPAYDTYLRNLGIAGALAKGAGLPDVLGPLTSALKDSPAYQAQVEIAKRTIGLPFTQAEELYKKQVEIAGVGPIEAAKLPYALAQEYFKADQQIRTAGPVAAAQNFERIKADNAAKGIITTMGADGQIKLSIDPDAVKAVTGATVTAPKQAEADIGRETKRIEQEQAARYEPITGGVPVMGADGKTTMMPMSRYEYDLRQRLQAERRGGAGVPASGPQPGDIVGTPYVSKEEELSQQSDQKRLDTMQATAQSSRLAIQNSNDLRQLIQNGAMVGPGADVREGLLKLGYALHLTGKDQNELIANTETFIARQGAELKSALVGLGPPISDRDAKVADAIAGNRNLTPQGLLELMEIKEKYHRQALDEYNQLAEKAPPSRYPRTVKEPPAYGAQIIEGPNGHKMWNKNGKWVEF